MNSPKKDDNATKTQGATGSERMKRLQKESEA